MYMSSPDTQPLPRFQARHALFPPLSTPMCAMFVYGLLRLGYQDQSTKVRSAGRRKVGQFAPGYFTFLTIQTVPMLLTGFVINDDYIMLTRGMMLVATVMVYGMTRSQDGALDTPSNRFWTVFWLVALVVSAMAWIRYAEVRILVREWERWIAAASVITMLLLLIGQREVASQLYNHYLRGNRTNRRLTLQLERLLYFVPQVIHYWLLPSTAAPIRIPFTHWQFDPILANGVIGTAGVTFVLVCALVGRIAGRSNRREQERLERELAFELHR